MKRIFLGSVAVIYLLIVLGCAAGTATMSTANLTYPVNIGPVKHIKGKSSAALTCKSQSPFYVEAENSHSYVAATENSSGHSSSLSEGQNKFDVSLMSYSIDGKGVIFNIDNIQYGSYLGGLLWGWYHDKSWVGINVTACKLD